MNENKKRNIEKIINNCKINNNKNNEFITKLLIINNNKSFTPEIELRIKNKGWFIYNKIFLYLKDKNINLDWRYINSIYILDKRLRNLLFKYISYIEEFYRSKIYDVLDNLDICNLLETKISFNELIQLLKKLELIDDELMKKLNKVKNLRNKISHHNILLLVKENGKYIENVNIKKYLKLLNELILNDNIKNEFIKSKDFIITKPINPKYNFDDNELVINEDIKKIFQ